ncbi:hypothetical protein D3C81_1874740 [compost metagenome]
MIGYLAQLHADREVFLDTGELDFQRLAQHQNVAALLHGDSQTNRIFPHEAHTRRRWIVEPTAHIRHIGDAERTITYADREVLDLVDRTKVARQA